MFIFEIIGIGKIAKIKFTIWSASTRWMTRIEMRMEAIKAFDFEMAMADDLKRELLSFQS